MNQNKSPFKKGSSAFFRIIFPFSAMRSSLVLAKKEAVRTKESLSVIKQLGLDAKEAINGKKNKRNDDFNSAMANRTTNALSRSQLYVFFMNKKRTILVGYYFFILIALYSLITGYISGSNQSMILSLLSLITSQPLFFLAALDPQLRLWQLKVKRLSKEEYGSLRDFIREEPHWWRLTLSFEFGYQIDFDNDIGNN